MVIIDRIFGEANKALLEGDRNNVLEILEGKPESTELLWLKAHAVEDDDERLALLRKVENQGRGVYSRMAREIIEREDHFSDELSKPPGYKFRIRQKKGKSKRNKNPRTPKISDIDIVNVLLIIIFVIILISAVFYLRWTTQIGITGLFHRNTQKITNRTYIV